MTEVAVTPEVTTITPRRKANGAAGPVRPSGAVRRFGPTNTQGINKTVVLNLEGGPLAVTYNLRRVSLEEHEQLGEMIESDDPERPKIPWLTAWLARVIVSWEFYLHPEDPEDETRYPLDAPALMKLPGEFLAEVGQGIREHNDPPAPATNSASFT